MSYQDLFGIVLTEIVGDFGFKYFANEGSVTGFISGVAGYIGVVYYLIRSLQGSQVLLVNAAWDGLSALVESLAAIFFLGEHFDDSLQYVGVILIICGLYFLKIPAFRDTPFEFPRLGGNKKS